MMVIVPVFDQRPKRCHSILRAAYLLPLHAPGWYARYDRLLLLVQTNPAGKAGFFIFEMDKGRKGWQKSRLQKFNGEIANEKNV